MTQTTSPAGGVVLEPSEFYYLLRMHAARHAIGLEDQGLLPQTGAEADALLQDGFAKLKFHGWLRPAERGRFDLHPELALLAAVVADPQFVVVAARQLNAAEAALANYYLGAELIVELTLTPERRVRLAFVADRPTLHARVAALLVPTPNPLPPAQVALPEPEFEALRAAARAGQPATAAGLSVLSPAHARSLAEALAAPVGDGRLAVVRTGGGEILGGRKATVYDGPAGAWLVHRAEAAAPALEVQTVQPGTVAGLVESYLQALWVLMEPVA